MSFPRFRSITQSYYRSAHALILVYDVTNQPTFDCCPDWLREIEEYASPKVLRALVGNKIDRDDHEIPGSGWYSEAVMATALRAEGNIYSVYVNDPVRHSTDNPTRIFAPDTAGVVVNRAGVHWFAYKHVDGAIWCLDSVREP